MLSRNSGMPRRTRLIWLVSLGVAAGGVGYVAWKVVKPWPGSGRDFMPMWLAGRLWSEGRSPYDPGVFRPAFARQFGEYHEDLPFVYPPNWAPVLIPLGYLPFDTAEQIWRAASFVLLLGTVVASALLVRPSIRAVMREPVFWLGLGACCLMQSVPKTLALGQTSLLASFSLALTFYALSRRSTPVATLGLALLLLKPQVAAAVVGLLLTVGAWRLLALGGGLSLAVAGLAGALSGVRANTVAWLAATRPHELLPPNVPAEVTGLRHLLSYAQVNLSPILAILLCVLAGVVLGLWLRHAHGHDVLAPLRAPATRSAFLAPLIAVVVTLAPLHEYDFVVLIPVLVIALLEHGPARYLLPGLALAYRSANLAAWTGIRHPAGHIFVGSLVATVGAVLVLAGALAYLWHVRRTEAPLAIGFRLRQLETEPVAEAPVVGTGPF
jgi:hypothetical protein